MPNGDLLQIAVGSDHRTDDRAETSINTTLTGRLNFDNETSKLTRRYLHCFRIIEYPPEKNENCFI